MGFLEPLVGFSPLEEGEGFGSDASPAEGFAAACGPKDTVCMLSHNNGMKV